MSNTDMTALLKQGEAESLRRQKIVQMALRIVVWRRRQSQSASW